ncbi:M48 family metallopeptidase [Crossiella cryophila]|uniref:Zn-dependent protease with chaperone function n=1 Tax=Crossiella cryophila TaxID=43355 RepID=A0A7W7CIR8_9PSEU|nr:M48 family metallopeptidase [Crossiella cryophila]MBB4681956.1 Zn-dependent protease with chaperone function [Crossiella cryophila]
MADDAAQVPVATGRTRFPQISPRAYEHPADRGALATARAVPGFPAVLKAIYGAIPERSERLLALATSIKVSETQYPELHRLRVECATALDLEQVPDLFITRDPHPNSYAMGMDEPFIVITTGLVELLDEEGLRFVLGHEMGHILSGHVLYYTILRRLIGLAAGMSWMPVGYWGLRAIILALQDWHRRSQLSADRAGLLCVQDPAVALRVHMILSGVTDPSKIDTAEYLKQAADYDGVEDVRDSVLKLIHLDGLTHPLPVVRAADLQQWAAGEQYRDILAGEYPRREDDSTTSNWKDDVKGAAKSYKEAITSSADPLAKVLSEVGSLVSDTAGKVWNSFTGGNRGGGDSSGGSGPDKGSGPSAN